jgi:hypothetical protein
MSDAEADMAEKITSALEGDTAFPGWTVDWNDLGEVTIQTGGRTYRMTVRDITDEG